MANKPPRSIAEQIDLLKSRGMQFQDDTLASHFLQNISYYRLKGYWWDVQTDKKTHTFHSDIYFEDIIERYTFDRHLRLILFDAIERIEVALRTQMIYHISHHHGPIWYQESNLFSDPVQHANNLSSLMREFRVSREIFIKDHKRRYPDESPESWKIMEIASLGTLSKYYKQLKHSLPAKAAVANGMGLNLHNELSSWLEAITYVRNIIAHHSRLYGRDMVKTPVLKIKNPKGAWLNQPISDMQKRKVFLIISCMLFVCNKVTPGHQIKKKVKELVMRNPSLPVNNLGFVNNWDEQDLWL